MSSPNEIKENEISYLVTPLSMRQIIFTADENLYVEGNVLIDVEADMLSFGYEAFLDALSENLVDSNLLIDISYKLIGATPDGKAIFHVRGNVSEALDFSNDLTEELKNALFANGVDALSDFVGKNFTGEEDSDTIENYLDETIEQMPVNELVHFFKKYISE